VGDFRATEIGVESSGSAKFLRLADEYIVDVVRVSQQVARMGTQVEMSNIPEFLVQA